MQGGSIVHNTDIRLEREVMRLEQALKKLKLTRYDSKAASDHFLRLKARHARCRALLDAQLQPTSRTPGTPTVRPETACDD